MGIWINGLDISKPPFKSEDIWDGHLSSLLRKLDEPVDTGRHATDADFKVWSLTGGRPVEACGLLSGGFPVDFRVESVGEDKNGVTAPDDKKEIIDE